MRTGDTVGGYTLTGDFRVVGAGLSEWTFAYRDGREYFLKRFLSPTFPDDDAPGSPETKARKRTRCAAFEAHQRGIQAALAPVTRYGGNLVATLDFFREGAKYYKVTEKIDVAGMDAAAIARLPLPARLVLMRTVAHSLKILHDLSIVHSDLKPNNVLIKRTERGYTTKLIDFDSSYVVGDPPPPEDIVGTMNYYSPELVRYVQGDAGAQELTEASDIFTLGLIYTEYLTGRLPSFDPAATEAAVAVLNGGVLTLPRGEHPDALPDLVERMMSPDPGGRPTIGEVHRSLLGIGIAAPTVARPVRATVGDPPTTSTTASTTPSTAGSTSGSGAPSTLRGRGLRLARGEAARGEAARGEAAGRRAEPAPTGVGRLMGRLMDRLDRGGSR